MVRNEKVIIFNGPKAAFDRYISEYYKHDGNNYNLTQLVNLSELERQTHLLKIEGHESSEEIEPSINIDLLYISNNEYSRVTEAVINNFVNYISKYNITKMIIQNPPIEIINDLKRQFNSKDIHIHNFKYKNINLQLIKTFKKHAPSVILGQEKILEHLGAPVFFRINCFIKYEDLSNAVKIKLIEKNYFKLLQQLSKSEQKIISESKIKDKYIQLANKFSNARQIGNFLRNEIARKLIETIE